MKKSDLEKKGWVPLDREFDGRKQRRVDWKWIVSALIVLAIFGLVKNRLAEKKQDPKNNEVKESAQIKAWSQEEANDIYFKKYLTPDEYKELIDLSTKRLEVGLTQVESYRALLFYVIVRSRANQVDPKKLDKAEQEFLQKLNIALEPFLLKEGKKEPAHPTDEEYDKFLNLSDKVHDIYSKYLTPQESTDFIEIGFKQTAEAATIDENNRADLYLNRVKSNAPSREMEIIHEYQRYKMKMTEYFKQH